ncbi:MAG: hypothetical protein GC154_19425 [bacterium]|nr:hypothetical protein [bacterium]
MIVSKKMMATGAMSLLLIAALMVGSLAVAHEGSGTAAPGLTVGAQQEESAEVANVKPAVIAVKLHADWCTKCQALGPILEDLTQRLGKDSEALLVKVDLTNDATKRQSQLLMSALGLSKVYSENSGKTGVLLLIDSKSGNVTKTLTSEMTAAQMEQAIRTASGASSGAARNAVQSPAEGSAPAKPEGSAPQPPEGS